MELTNEEKKVLFDAALELAKAFATLHMASERLSMMSQLSTKMLSISLDEDTVALATMPFKAAYDKAIDGLLSAMGVGGMDDPFRKFLNEKIAEEKRKSEEEEKAREKDEADKKSVDGE